MDPVERDNIRVRFKHIGLKSLKEFFKVIKIETEQKENLNDLVEIIIVKLDNGELKKDKLLNLIDYFEFSNKIEHKTLGLTNKQFREILKIKEKSRDFGRSQLIEELREKIYKLEIKSNEIGEYFLESILRKIKNPEILAFVSTKLSGDAIESISLDEFVKLAIGKVKSGEIEEDELVRLVDTVQKDLSELQKAQKLEAIERDVSEIKKTLDKVLDYIERREQIGYLRQYRKGTGIKIAEFLHSVKKINQKIDVETGDKFDEIIEELKRENIDMYEFVEQANWVSSMVLVSRFVSKKRFPISSDYFYKVAYEESNKMYFASRPIIYKIRDAVTKRLDVSNEEFKNKLIECLENGDINLIEGSPVSGKDDDWMDINGRRFYYLEFKRKLDI